MPNQIFINKKFVLFLAYGYSLKMWNSWGHLERNSAIYLKFRKIFKNIYFVTYGNNEDRNFLKLLNGIIVLTKGILPNFIFYFFSPFIYRRAIKNADIYKSFQFSGALPALISKFLYGGLMVMRGGYITSIFSKKSHSWKYPFIKIIEFLCVKNADAILIPSRREKEYLVLNYKVNRDKVYILPNYIDTQLFKLQVIKKSDKVTLCYVGRLDRQKNIYSLFEVMKGLKECKFIIIGDGCLRNWLVNSCAKNGLDVDFHRVLNNYELPKFYNMSSIYIFTSLYEGGSPKTVLEAMACGIPCVCLRSDGADDIIRHGENGFICDTTEEMVSTINAVARDVSLQNKIGSQARNFVVNNFSLDVVYQKELDIYRILLKK